MLAEPVNGAVDLRHHPDHLPANLAQLGNEAGAKSRPDCWLVWAAQRRIPQESASSQPVRLVFGRRNGRTDSAFDVARFETGRCGE
jgi:hypothetical protein